MQRAGVRIGVAQAIYADRVTFANVKHGSLLVRGPKLRSSSEFGLVVLTRIPLSLLRSETTERRMDTLSIVKSLDDSEQIARCFTQLKKQALGDR
ncbi:hypothetical protein [Methylobacterium sp. WL7]|uniref:hypothetical protein n=1 Tax=Methylobacterium sp. WL7 TaxID=2603900 RepID=UPI0011CC3FB9|nr:hypothetical protein [Methylobacterium sp. WL7]TXN43410.1 hypothetical protein FV233_18625 [Methylobacterium sp. WL7]